MSTSAASLFATTDVVNTTGHSLNDSTEYSQTLSSSVNKKIANRSSINSKKLTKSGKKSLGQKVTVHVNGHLLVIDIVKIMSDMPKMRLNLDYSDNWE